MLAMASDFQLVLRFPEFESYRHPHPDEHRASDASSGDALHRFEKVAASEGRASCHPSQGDAKHRPET